MIKVIIGFLLMFGFIFQASGIAMWGDAASLTIVVGVIVGGTLASGKNITTTISAIFKKQTDIASLREAQSTLKEAGRLGMAIGLIGFLIGAANMLLALDDPAALGPAMSMCLLIVLYGTTFKYLIFDRIICILEDRAKQLD